MKTWSYAIVTILCFLLGLMFYAYQQEWIILHLPLSKIQEVEKNEEVQPTTFSQKKITLYFWKHKRWHTEHTTIIWSSDIIHTIQTIVNNWLMLLEEEKLIDTDIQLDSAVIAGNKELFLSFNKNICSSQDSTFTKIMIISGLLKTLHENKINIQSVRFLIHHQIMTDDHLNFTISWPILGYLQT